MWTSPSNFHPRQKSATASLLWALSFSALWVNLYGFKLLINYFFASTGAWIVFILFIFLRWNTEVKRRGVCKVTAEMTFFFSGIAQPSRREATHCYEKDVLFYPLKMVGNCSRCSYLRKTGTTANFLVTLREALSPLSRNWGKKLPQFFTPLPLFS